MRSVILFGIFSIFTISGCNLLNRDDKRFAQIEERLATIEKSVLSNKDAEQDKPFDFPVGDSYYLGKKDAKVSIVVFTNLQCGYCSRADNALREVMNDSELKKNVNLVMKHFPFLNRSKPAVKAAFAAGEQGSEKFWEISKKMFAHQAALTDENFSKWASELSLDPKKFASDLANNDKKYEDMLAKDMELVKMAKITGTPYVYVGGFAYDGELTAQSIAEFIKKNKLL